MYYYSKVIDNFMKNLIFIQIFTAFLIIILVILQKSNEENIFIYSKKKIGYLNKIIFILVLFFLINNCLIIKLKNIPYRKDVKNISIHIKI